MSDVRKIHDIDQALAATRTFARGVALLMHETAVTLVAEGWSPADAREAGIRAGLAYVQKPLDPPTDKS